MYLYTPSFTWQNFACAHTLTRSLCNDFLTYLLMRLVRSLCLHSSSAFSSSRPSGRWTWHLTLQLDQKKCIQVRRLHTDSIWLYFFRVHSRTILLLGPIPKVSLPKAEKYVHELITELYPAFHNVQLAFADGSSGGALCVSQCMERLFETTVFLSITC